MDNNIFPNNIYICQTIEGKGRGEGLGFPTINMVIPANFPLSFGVYAGWLNIGNSLLEAAIHYGPIPVFNDKEPSLEVYAINATISQRPEEVSIQIIKKIRDIKSFKNPTKLKQQIKKDIAQIQKCLNVASESS